MFVSKLERPELVSVSHPQSGQQEDRFMVICRRIPLSSIIKRPLQEILKVRGDSTVLEIAVRVNQQKLTFPLGPA